MRTTSAGERESMLREENRRLREQFEALRRKPEITQEEHWPSWTEHFYEHNGALVYKFANERLILIASNPASRSERGSS